LVPIGNRAREFKNTLTTKCFEYGIIKLHSHGFPRSLE
jgi:hypothetical protein